MGRTILLIGAVCGVAAVLYLRPHHYVAKQIVFPVASSVDMGRVNDNYVGATGTLTGEGVRHENNAVEISCYKSEGRCLLFRVEQIGDNYLNLIGPIGMPTVFLITRWDPSLVVATNDEDSLSGYPGGCIKSTVNLGRDSYQFPL